jgi:CDP-diacylglycerol--serine O-phosphatidyltransferase
MVDIHVTGQEVRWLAWGVTLFAGLSMISNFRFYSGKDINLKRSVPFIVIVLVALAFSLISIDPPIVLFLLFFMYGLSGYVHWAKRYVGRKAQNKTSNPLPPAE